MLPYKFGDFVQGLSAKNWEMLQLLRLIQWRLHVDQTVETNLDQKYIFIMTKIIFEDMEN